MQGAGQLLTDGEILIRERKQAVAFEGSPAGTREMNLNVHSSAILKLSSG